MCDEYAMSFPYIRRLFFGVCGPLGFENIADFLFVLCCLFKIHETECLMFFSCIFLYNINVVAVAVDSSYGFTDANYPAPNTVNGIYGTFALIQLSTTRM